MASPGHFYPEDSSDKLPFLVNVSVEVGTGRFVPALRARQVPGRSHLSASQSIPQSAHVALLTFPRCNLPLPTLCTNTPGTLSPSHMILLLATSHLPGIPDLLGRQCNPYFLIPSHSTSKACTLGGQQHVRPLGRLCGLSTKAEVMGRIQVVQAFTADTFSLGRVLPQASWSQSLGIGRTAGVRRLMRSLACAQQAPATV